MSADRFYTRSQSRSRAARQKRCFRSTRPLDKKRRRRQVKVFPIKSTPRIRCETRSGRGGYEVTGRHVRAVETIDIIALPQRGFVISIVVKGRLKSLFQRWTELRRDDEFRI